MQKTQDKCVYSQHIQTLPSAHKRQATPLELEPHMNPFSPDRILAAAAAANAQNQTAQAGSIQIQSSNLEQKQQTLQSMIEIDKSRI